jgi:aminoglycoside phosphotransferase (APT) family kinase protein
MEPIGKGLSAELFDNGDGTVTKRYLSAMPPSLWRQDYEISKLVSCYYRNSPRVLGLTDGDPYPGILFDKVDGRNLVQELVSHPFRLSKLARAFARIHADIHKHAVPGLPDQRRRLIEGIDKSGVEASMKLKLHGFLLESDGEAALCHNDFMPTNVVCSAEGMVVVDWRTADIGNPLCDIARTIVLNRVPRKDIGLSALHGAMRHFFVEAYKFEYARAEKVKDPELNRWIVINAVLRLGEGVSARERAKLLVLINRMKGAFG